MFYKFEQDYKAVLDHSTVTRNFAQVARTLKIRQGQVGLKQ